MKYVVMEVLEVFEQLSQAGVRWEAEGSYFKPWYPAFTHKQLEETQQPFPQPPKMFVNITEQCC